jgi:hypothetical protein
MSLPDSVFDISVKVLHWLNPFVWIVGLAVGVWAYSLTRKVGYLLVTFYFLLVLCSSYILPPINRMMEGHRDRQQESDISPQAHEQFIKELATLEKKYFPPRVAVSPLRIDLPFGPILLVAGLWMLAKRETRRIAESN